MIGYIYKITNNINGKIYIGKRKKSKFDESYWGSGKHIKNSINKYGKENFTREVIEWCPTEEELNNREKFWIEYFDSLNPEIGYNLVSGGLGGSSYGKDNGAFNKHWYTDGNSQILCEEKDCPYGWVPGYSKERLDKLRNINLGKRFSDEHKENIRKGLRLHPSSGMLGKHQSDKQKEAVSKAHKDKNLSEDTKCKIRNSLHKFYAENGSPLTGRKLTEEHKKHLSEAHKGKTHKSIGEEARRKIGNANREHYKGKIIVNDGKKCYYILPEKLDYYLSIGYKRGRIKRRI